ncbi:hypothetical protein PPACK8108_LOCUS2594 [Phakopsora pachyrhizi]|uniref:Uncharacterized protein n=1 Tax=Phakopsora pachyrhizi TaxID=170000 RepID=A0AAV0AKX9_PHAPC|nr:hypothetical protein PPACK8108_LOCUS2594 [Phakopsora pachyrhizi]
MTNRTLVIDVEPPNNSEPQIRQLPTPTTPRDARIIALVLASMGVQSSFKGVVRVLMEFAHQYFWLEHRISTLKHISRRHCGRVPSSNYSSFRIKPLTQLKPEPGAEVQRHVTQSPEQLRDSNRGLETSHSQRGINWSTLGVEASLPNLTLGTRVRSKDPQFNDTTSWQIGPHPYGLILPGQEVRRPPVKTRTVSNVTQSMVRLLRSVSSNRNKTISIGSCCFTQTAKSPISGGGTLSAVSTSNQAAALHARRFSTIARDPSVAIVSPNLSAAGNNNKSVNITEGQKQLLLV